MTENFKDSAMNQTEVDNLISIIDRLQKDYLRNMRKRRIFVVDTCYLLNQSNLPKHSQIFVPFQVIKELKKLSLKMKKRVKDVEIMLMKMQNISFQSKETNKMCKKMFNLKKCDYDGHILAAALFVKECYPFRNVTLLTHDKELNIRCFLIGIESSDTFHQ